MVSIQALHNLINTTTHKYIKKYFKKKLKHNKYNNIP